MSRDEIWGMSLEEVEARASELDSLVETSENEEELIKAKEERALLNERKAELKDLEERKAIATAIQNNEVVPNVIEERKGEIEMKKVEEYRNSKEYINAFAEYIKSGDDTEVRALLTTNVGDAGQVAVPSLVYDEIKTAWDKNEIMSLITRINVKANYQVEFEISGDDAIIHNEGSGAVSEESLSHGIATLIPEDIIKWITISREAKAMRGEDFLRYVYKELSYKIVKKAADNLIGKIAALPTSATSTTPSAAKVKMGTTVSTVVTAIGNLSDEAANPVIVMNKLSYASLKSAAYAAGYSIDPFEGLDVKYNNTLPAYSAASENDVWMIVGDFGYGALANFPEGEIPVVTIDELTKRKQGMIEVVGDLFMSAEPVACKAFTLVTKPAAI
jgi:HK97 family phage major capsid protein